MNTFDASASSGDDLAYRRLHPASPPPPARPLTESLRQIWRRLLGMPGHERARPAVDEETPMNSPCL